MGGVPEISAKKMFSSGRERPYKPTTIGFQPPTDEKGDKADWEDGLENSKSPKYSWTRLSRGFCPWLNAPENA